MQFTKLINFSDFIYHVWFKKSYQRISFCLTIWQRKVHVDDMKYQWLLSLLLLLLLFSSPLPFIHSWRFYHCRGEVLLDTIDTRFYGDWPERILKATPTVTRSGPHPEPFTCWALDEGTFTTYTDVLGLTRRWDEIRTRYLKVTKTSILPLRYYDRRHQMSF